MDLSSSAYFTTSLSIGSVHTEKFRQKYTQRVNAVSGAVTYEDIRAIPLNCDKTLQFQIKNVVFTDSFHFLAASLDTLVSTLKRADKQKFVQTTKYLGDDDLVFEKGHFPYAYFDSLKRLDETTLPPKSAFYNDLTESDISDRDYNHAVSVW